MAAYAIGFFVPFVMGLYLSFCEFTTLSDAVFTGFDNYVRAFSDAGEFVHALWFTALFAALSTAAVNVLGLAAALVFPFTALIEASLRLPYLTPSAGTVLSLAAATLAMTLAIGALASGWAAFRLSRVDPGATLREGA